MITEQDINMMVESLQQSYDEHGLGPYVRVSDLKKMLIEWLVMD